MKKISKLLAVLILCLTTTFCAGIAPAEKSQPSKPTYDYNFYTDHFKNIISNTNKILDNYRNYLTSEEAQTICDRVLIETVNYITSNKLYILRKPTVDLFKLTNGKTVAFILRIEISFLDREESKKDLINTLKITKKFLIFYGDVRPGVDI